MRRLTLATLLITLLLSACTPTVILLTPQLPTDTPTPVPSPAPTLTVTPTDIPNSQLGIGPGALRDANITVWHGLDGESGALLAQMVQEFNLANIWGIKVQVVSQKNMQLLGGAVDSALHTPQAPDLVLALPEQALAWDAQGLVTDLAPYLAHGKYGFSGAELADFPAAFLSQGEVNGKRVSLPAVRTARFIFYNASFAKELGFNTPPQTFDDFRKQACTANASWKNDQDLKNDGYGGWVLDNQTIDTDAPWTAYAWLRASGGDVYADGKYQFSSTANQQALNALSLLHNDGCAWISTAADNLAALSAHKALFAAGSLEQFTQQRAAFAGNPDQWTVIPFPGTDPAIITYGPDYVIMKSSEVRQLAAWLFVRWTLSPENQARWARQTGLFPMRLSAVDQMQNIRLADPQWAAAVDLLKIAKTYPQTASWSKARLVLGDGFFTMFQMPASMDQATPVLDEMDATMQALLPK
jgi:multiple sugar transport system substrate-binding protein